MVRSGYYSKLDMSYKPKSLATEKFESTKYCFINHLIWASSILSACLISYLS